MKLYLLLAAITLTVHVKKPSKVHPGDGMFSCSAVMISKDTALSAAHCYLPTPSTVWVKTMTGVVHEAKVMALDKDKDLALIRLNHPININPPPIGSMPNVVDPIYLVSSEDDMPNTYGEGRVANLVTQDGQNLIIHTASILPGASGSGLFNEHGALIGINVMMANALTMAVDTEDIKQFLVLHPPL